jgi:hypothetical protein
MSPTPAPCSSEFSAAQEILREPGGLRLSTIHLETFVHASPKTDGGGCDRSFVGVERVDGGPTPDQAEPASLPSDL